MRRFLACSKRDHADAISFLQLGLPIAIVSQLSNKVIGAARCQAEAAAMQDVLSCTTYLADFRTSGPPAGVIAASRPDVTIAA